MKPSIDKMVKNLCEQEGAHVDLKKKLSDGTYDNASDKDLSLLNSKTMLLSTAQNFKDMNFNDKLKAAIELKQRGNVFFQKNEYSAAQELYLQALTAAEFGNKTNSESGESDEDISIENSNIDELVVPVLCNMAVCALKLNQFVKAARFCDEALKLRPVCLKALLRRGIAFLHLKEYDLCISSLEQAKDSILATVVEESVDDSECSTNQNQLSKSAAADLANVEHNLLLARHARQEERQRLKQQRENLQRAFGIVDSQGPAPSSITPPSTEGPTSLTTLIQSLLHRILLWINNFVRLVVLYLLRLAAKRHDINKND